MKPDENLFTESELTNFLASIKLKSDEDLLSAYLLVKDKYSREFMDIIRDELGLVYQEDRLTAFNITLVTLIGFFVILLAVIMFLLHSRKFVNRNWFIPVLAI
jgi:hypothetical protein